MHLKPAVLELGGKAPLVILDDADLDDAVDAAAFGAFANDNEFGLSAAVFGRDVARAINVARRIESGICHVNGPTVDDEAQMPFGGVKGSGMGRFGGKAGLHEFTELRWITVQAAPRHCPFRGVAMVWKNLANFDGGCRGTGGRPMGTMNISLPDTLRDFVDDQIARGGYGTSSEYVRELIRRDQERLRLRALLLEGAESPATGEADAPCFAALRARVSSPKPAKRCA